MRLGLTVCCALALAACSGRPDGEEREAPLLPGLLAQLNSVTEVQVQRAGGAVVTLRRDPNGWRLLERDWPADATRLRPLLLALAQAHCDAPRTSQPTKYSRIGVEPIDTPGARSTLVTVRWSGGEGAVVVGREHAQGGSYLRVADKAQACLSSVRPPLAESEPDWLDTRLFTRSANTFTEVQVFDGAAPPLRLRPQGGRFAVNGVMPGSNALPDGIAGAFTDFRLGDVRVSSSNVEPQRRLVFLGGDGITLTLFLWREGDGVWFRLQAEARPDAAASAQAFVAGLTDKTTGREFLLPGHQVDAIMASPAALSAP